jgi:hypothetical protein
MLSLSVYKVAHLFGVLLVFLGFGALVGDGNNRRTATIAHGLGLVIVLVAGFGALARLGIYGPSSWPLWIWLKLAIWLALGALVTVAKRSRGAAKSLWWLLPVLGAAAAYLAIYKPGA